MLTRRPKQIQTLQALELYLNTDTAIERHNGYNASDIKFFLKKLSDASIGRLVNRDSRTIKRWRDLV